jgi:hypothetical protein
VHDGVRAENPSTELAVLQRRQPRGPPLTWADRALLAALLSVIPKARRNGLLLVTPDAIPHRPATSSGAAGPPDPTRGRPASRARLASAAAQRRQLRPNGQVLTTASGTLHPSSSTSPHDQRAHGLLQDLPQRSAPWGADPPAAASTEPAKPARQKPLVPLELMGRRGRQGWARSESVVISGIRALIRGAHPGQPARRGSTSYRWACCVVRRGAWCRSCAGQR